ncbi:GspH/FimT family pseudopilin [Zhongshania sp.]|jgi:type IV fimbrial biogenesis protein FimT|uniref:GspH/FimT family pseudopilin n=1 Tax=Zhongshania sp. TaxID=1971902 RepID=UPI001B67624D|nr:GspH/FimT family pseudopilin [Zhongshania sp.]MBQ0796602.1 GspH/FimT family pseudopilin [Zhongshania sp.]
MLGLGRQRGYTLLELMVTLGIVAILAGVAVPSFNGFIQTQRLRSAANDLTTSFNLARSESVKRNVDVLMAPSQVLWSDGWLVKLGDGSTLYESAKLNGVDVTASANSFTFQSNGRVTSSGTFSLEGVGGSTIAKCVRLKLSGGSVVDEGACP